MDNKLIDFIDEKLNDNGKAYNSTAYDKAFYAGSKDVEIVFNRNHRELYNRLLHFCADNGMTVVSTHPCTLATVVRVDI